MLLDSHKQTDGAQHATLYLQIPAVEVASAENAGAVYTEGRFDRLESFIGRPPMLSPDGGCPRPGQCDIERTPSPGGEPIVQAAAQTRQRLEQMEERRQRTQLQPSNA